MQNLEHGIIQYCIKGVIIFYNFQKFLLYPKSFCKTMLDINQPLVC